MTAGGVTSDSIHKAVIENGKYAAFQVYDDAGFMMAHSTAGASIGNSILRTAHPSLCWQEAAQTRRSGWITSPPIMRGISRRLPR